jgi:hypothetical protein
VFLFIFVAIDAIGRGIESIPLEEFEEQLGGRGVFANPRRILASTLQIPREGWSPLSNARLSRGVLRPWGYRGGTQSGSPGRRRWGYAFVGLQVGEIGSQACGEPREPNLTELLEGVPPVRTPV